MKYKVLGRSAGKTIVQFESGLEKKLTDAQFAELKGGAAVKKLSDEKEIARLIGLLNDAQAEIDALTAEVDPLKVELKAKNEAIEELLEKDKKQAAEIDELKAALKAAEKAKPTEPKKSVKDSAETK